MNDYQFWDELGKIFNAVMAYQEKAVEFNKRFINPWIPLGNVFGQRDRNNDAVRAYHQAIELDPSNAQNWYELGNVHFRMKSFDEAAEAYRQAMEIQPDYGAACSNLALTLASQGRLAEAIPLYHRSIELLQDDREKAVAWNRLGNLHRKLNEYSLAVEAFQKADELDADNAGFRDELGEASGAQVARQEIPAPVPAEPSAVGLLDPLQLIVAEGGADAVARAAAATAEEQEAAPETHGAEGSADAYDGLESPLVAEAPAGQSDGSGPPGDGVAVNIVAHRAGSREPAAAEAAGAEPEAGAGVAEQVEPAPEAFSMSVYAAYEEYLRDNDQPIEFPMESETSQAGTDGATGAHQDASSNQAAGADTETEPGPRLPAAKVDAAGELQIEMDARNAHVWNELGNIYFNNAQFDDAVIAYSKAIELDRWFAWPYSNLALTYVQKNRLSEAILLYQRSIELFKEPKDQAVSWNRLGNVYRRLNDYEHAIAAYQRADELDPENASLSMQSRFSLLGSFAVDNKPSYVS